MATITWVDRLGCTKNNKKQKTNPQNKTKQKTSHWEANYFSFRNCHCLAKLEELCKVSWPWLTGPPVFSAVERNLGEGTTVGL